MSAEVRQQRSHPRLFQRLAPGAALGCLIGVIIKDLDLPLLVSWWHGRIFLVPTCILLAVLIWMSRWRSLASLTALGVALLWLAVAFTPLTVWMENGLVRRDPPQKADAVFVLASGLQYDGEPSSSAMSRLVRGLQLLGEGWAPRLILSELPPPYPKYKDFACQLMDSFGLEQEIIVVEPVSNTHDEAVLVGAVFRDWGFERVIMVTSPSHSRRAAAALEARGVRVISVPSMETDFDLEQLHHVARSDDRVRAFGPLLHERVGLLYYRLRGWI